MECTQRMECSQEPYDTFNERSCPEQIGFLGICGAKHPVKKGPNKIGRDPQTCSIVLNDNSISRQHAVINILNKKDFMLMDLDSSNKTKLQNKTLQPYIPHPLQNGDTVQFGTVFGIFRLFEEDDALPMTQAVDIPDTPICTRNVTRLKTVPITTVPESPDVSDRDDSIIGQSPRNNNKSPNNSFIKPKKLIGAQDIGTNKINNVYWTSSKKSDSFSSHFESNGSFKSPKKLTVDSSIYDMETQVPGLPAVDETSHSIYEAETQVPKNNVSPTIYSCDTQVSNAEKLPEVYKVRNQNNVELNLYSGKENEQFNIFEAETQVTFQGNNKVLEPTLPTITDKHKNHDLRRIQNKLNSSDEEICFDDVDCHQDEDEFGSQPLLPPDLDDLVPPIINKENQHETNKEKNESKSSAVLNDSEKDSEEIAPSQEVIEKPIEDEDVTDCEDNNLEFAISVIKDSNKIDDEETDCEDDIKTVNVKSIKKSNQDCDDDLTDCEDEVIEISQNRSKVSTSLQDFDDLPTQVIGEENVDKEKISEPEKEDIPFDEMLTQVIDDCTIEADAVASKENISNKSIPFEDLQTQVLDIEILQEQSSSMTKQNRDTDNFKRPIFSPKIRKKDVILLNSSKSPKPITEKNLQSKVENEENYYDATQDILVDLCTQSEQDNTAPSKVETHDLSGDRNNLNMEKSSNGTEKIDRVISSMSKEEVRKVIGANIFVAPLSKKNSSDSSDLEVTPKKFNLSKFMMIDLPDSQDIKSCDFVKSKKDDTDSSDGFEDEENEEHNSQGGTRKRKRKKDIKLDLMKKFDANTLPTRAITRIRKPTSKILDGDSSIKKLSERILQSQLGLDKDHEIDREIVELNLRRLRRKMEKVNNKTNNSNIKSEKGEKDQSLQSIDKKESKEHISPVKTEKSLRQQDIKTAFKKPSTKSLGTETHSNVKTESIESARESRRSSRNKSKLDKKDVKEPKVKVEASEGKKSSSRSHTSRKEKKETIDLTTNEQTEVRRSKRHRSSKDKVEDKKEKLQRNSNSEKSGKLSTVVSENISTVYNLSSETAVDSPSNLKRQASSEISSSKPKRAKPSASNASGRSSTLRGVKTQYVLFTAFPCEEVKQKLEKLGAVIVSDVKVCTVVLTLQLRRTFKMLCAIGLGKPIVGPNWVQACVDSNMIVDPWLYLIKDEASEKRFCFNLRQTLTGRRNYLKGCNVFCTPNVSPCEQEMKCIVECSGGTWKQGGRRWFCVTSSADKEMWPDLQRRGATLVKAEFVLGGVLQQRINLDRDKLG